MITITKEFNWSMAHLLEGHEGLCKNLHGHNFKLFLTIAKMSGFSIKGEFLKDGMITDFGTIKKIGQTEIIDNLDHCFMYNKNDADSLSIAKVLEGQIKQKVVEVDFRVTSENLVMYIVDKINNYFNDFNIDLVCIKGVLYETDTSFATYEVKK